MNRENRNSPSDRYVHFEHTPFTLEYDGVKAEMAKDGTIKITQDHDDGTFDEINCKPAFFNRVWRMIVATRRKTYKNKPFSGEESKV